MSGTEIQRSSSWYAAWALVLSVILVACQAAPSTPAASNKTSVAPAAGPGTAVPAAQAGQGERLVIAIPAFGGESALPWRAGNQADTTLWNPVLEGLVWTDPGTMKIGPGLAEYSPSADYRSWTFKLRQGVMFHDGFGELTSDDVRFTIERMLKPDALGGAGPYLRATVDRVETPDKYTVVLQLKKPDWGVPFNLFTLMILSKKQLEQQGEDAVAVRPAGTGPYKVADVQQGAEYRLVAAADNHYRFGRPAFKEMVIRRIADPAARMAGLRAGEIDLAEVSGDYLSQVTGNLRLIELPGILHYWIVLTGQTVPTNPDYCPTCPWVGDEKDPASMERALKVRDALELAINKQDIVDGLWKGKGSLKPFSYGYTETNEGFNPAWAILPYDLGRAKQLLTEAGYPSGFSVTMNPAVTPFSADAPDVMEAVALDWEKLGLNVTRKQEDMPSFIPKLRARNTDKSFFLYSPPPQDSPTIWWIGDAHPKAGFYFLQDRLYTEDIDGATAETDAAKRTALERAIGDKLDAGHFGIKIGVKSLTFAVSKKVSDWKPNKWALASNYATITWSGQ